MTVKITVTGDVAADGSSDLISLVGVAAEAVAIDADLCSSATGSADVIVIDDRGAEFRDRPDSWPPALHLDRATGFVLHQVGRPLATGVLWESLSSYRGPGRITVVRADDLRAMEGVNISQGVSWERTAKDSSYQIRSLEQFSRCPLLVVLFGTEGAILYRNEVGHEPEALLVFDPVRLEGAFRAAIDEPVGGSTAAFTAALTCHVARFGLDSLEIAVADGLGAARRHLRGDNDQHTYQFCEIEPAEYGPEPDPGFWRIVEQQTRNTRLIVAEDIVRYGKTDGLNAVPKGSFGALETIDRAEIENYSAIRELLAEYIANPSPSRPLCIAVFGPPGAGKSFGVKQVMKSLRTDGVTAKTYNIAQFRGLGDLTTALHEVRSIASAGELPFIFFDEFDSAMDGAALGWLASFLAPMNDGEFKDGDLVHSIGKAIFVFAGGTKPTLAEFARLEDPDFKDVKGPDFVSRLRGFVDVMGPNRQHCRDNAYILRRALVLRGNFIRNAKTADLVDPSGAVKIDSGVLRALLHISDYKHGMRSMEALLDMSRINKAERFNLASLPPKTQLDLHVDADEFLWLTRNERYQTTIAPQDWVETEITGRIGKETAFVEQVAEQIFRNVIKHRRLEGKAIRLPKDWDALTEDAKQSFRDSAKDIPNKLRAVKHGIRRIPDGRDANVPDISDDDIRALAKLEHGRRCQYLRLNGYSFAETTDKQRKKSSRLVAFEDMPVERVDHYIQGIYAIPVMLKALGYEIFRMEEHVDFSNRELLETLARLVHEDYVNRQLEASKTRETNESLVPFEELSADKVASNMDNAGSIPKKLRRIGYRIVKLRPGEPTRRLALTDAQVDELAQMEHSRWLWQALMQGWTYRPGTKSEPEKTNPCILPWDQLDEDTKQYDVNTVRLIPTLLEKAGYSAIAVVSTSQGPRA